MFLLQNLNHKFSEKPSSLIVLKVTGSPSCSDLFSLVSGNNLKGHHRTGSARKYAYKFKNLRQAWEKERTS